jgi:hypothetical protein
MAVFSFFKNKTFRITALIVVVLGICGIVYGIFLFNKKASDLNDVKPQFTVSSTELFSDFDSNEKAATAKYAGKVVEVSGKVAQVEFSPADSTVSITLRDDDQLSGVICTLAKHIEKSPEIKTGETISIRGECSGMLMDVLLNNCVLVGKK